MAERTLEAAPGTSPLGHRLLLPPHDRLPACLQTHWQAAQPEGGGALQADWPPSAAIAQRHFGNCSFSLHSLCATDWKRNYNVHVASAARAVFLWSSSTQEAGLNQDGTISYNTEF